VTILLPSESSTLGALEGIQISENKELSTLGSKRDMQPVVELLSSSNNPVLSSLVVESYRAMIDFAAQQFERLGLEPAQSVADYCNRFAADAGLKEPPPISEKRARKNGLMLARINIGKEVDVVVNQAQSPNAHTQKSGSQQRSHAATNEMEHGKEKLQNSSRSSRKKRSVEGLSARGTGGRVKHEPGRQRQEDSRKIRPTKRPRRRSPRNTIEPLTTGVKAEPVQETQRSLITDMR